MIVTVNGRDYRVRLRAAAWPHLRILSSSFTDANISEDQLAQAEEKVLKLCVVGEVHEEDADELLMKILSCFARLVSQEFRSFRPQIPNLTGEGG